MPPKVAAASGNNVIWLHKRSLAMLKKDLILRNPLRLVGKETGQALSEGEFGVIIARAGVGKTSFMVQLALDSLLRHKNVLHISLDQPVKKVCLWYEEVFRHISEHYKIDNTSELWDTILPHRFIMTFKEQVFTVPRLEERLTDLTEQGIFFPQVVLIDGLSFDDTVRDVLGELKILAREQGFPIWFTAMTYQADIPDKDGVPSSVNHVSDLFETMVLLKPKGRKIYVNLIGATEGEISPSLVLDPSTLLIQDDREAAASKK